MQAKLVAGIKYCSECTNYYNHMAQVKRVTHRFTSYSLRSEKAHNLPPQHFVYTNDTHSVKKDLLFTFLHLHTIMALVGSK